jgi:hypothetical protein
MSKILPSEYLEWLSSHPPMTANEKLCIATRPRLRADKVRRFKLKEPSIATKAKNFTAAVVKHVAAGGRQATDEQVADRFAICEQCPLFKPKGDGQGVCTHSSCGCSLKAVGLTGRNKLRWADSACPIGSWKAAPAE